MHMWSSADESFCTPLWDFLSTLQQSPAYRFLLGHFFSLHVLDYHSYCIFTFDTLFVTILQSLGADKETLCDVNDEVLADLLSNRSVPQPLYLEVSKHLVFT
jgi:hypothetical protein